MAVNSRGRDRRGSSDPGRRRRRRNRPGNAQAEGPREAGTLESGRSDRVVPPKGV